MIRAQTNNIWDWVFVAAIVFFIGFITIPTTEVEPKSWYGLFYYVVNFGCVIILSTVWFYGLVRLMAIKHRLSISETITCVLLTLIVPVFSSVCFYLYDRNYIGRNDSLQF